MSARAVAIVALGVALAIAAFGIAIWRERPAVATRLAAPMARLAAASESGDVAAAIERGDTNATSTAATPSSVEPFREREPQELAGTQPDPDEPDPDEVVDIFGTVVLVGRDRAERAGEDGHFELEFVEERAEGSEAVVFSRWFVEVVDGVFRTTGPRRSRMVPRSLVLGGADAAVKSTVPAELPTGRVLHVFAYRCSIASLDVLDKATHAPLSGVTVLRAHGDFAVVPVATRAEEIVVRDGVSPVELTAGEPALEEPVGHESDTEAFLVGAPGYAWSRVEVSFAPDAVNVVELQAGAELDVVVRGERPQPVVERVAYGWQHGEPVEVERNFDLTIRVHREPTREERAAEEHSLAEMIVATELFEGRWPAEEVTQARSRLRRSWRRAVTADHCVAETACRGPGPWTFHGIPAGSYHVRVEVGGVGPPWVPGETPLVVGACSVAVSSGRRGFAGVTIDPFALDRRRVPLSGELHLSLEGGDAEFGLDRLEYELVGLDVRVPAEGRSRALCIPESSAETPGVLRWDAGTVAPGRWLLRNERLQWEHELDVGPAGLTGVVLHVRAPADVRVHVRDAATGAPIRVEGLVASSPPAAPHRRTRASIDRATDAFDLRWGSGRIRLGVIGGFRIVGPYDFDVVPGTNEIELRVRRACGVAIRLLEAGEPRAWPPALAAATTAARLDAPATTACRLLNEHSLHWHFAEPGLWRLTFPPIPGFDPLPPLDVEVPADRIVDRDVELVRAR